MISKSSLSRARLVRGALTAAAIALFTACGSDSTGPSNASVSGNYALSTVNGSSLPFTVTNTGDNVEIVQAATLSLAADSTYTVHATGTENGSDANIITDVGHYSVSGSHVSFTSTVIEGGNYSATVGSSAGATTLTTSIIGAFVGSADASFTLVFTRSS